jgi:two-component system cell cycle sensor histidine kinase/response regulator CckA
MKRWRRMTRFWIYPRRLIERLADRNDHLLKVLIEQAGVGIAVIDRHGAIVRVNDKLRKMVTSNADLRLGSPVLDIFCPERRGEVWAEIEPALRGGRPPRPFNATLGPLRPVDGDQPTVIVSAIPLLEVDGNYSGAILEVSDISTQRQLETQLAQSQKFQAVGQLAAGIAHDFNNLLTAIMGAADDGIDRASADHAMLEDLHQIRTSAGRGADLVRQLLAFSRQQALQPRVLALDDAVLKLSVLLRRVLGGKVQLDLAFEAAGQTVRVDPTQLDQVLINLAVNARHAMQGGGKLTLRTGQSILERALVRGAETIPPGHYVMVEVQDTGVGIPAAVLPRIFDPFFTTRREQGGSGLGLSTVDGIVRQSGGYLEVESEEGRGTRFRIYLPRYEAPAIPIPAAQPAVEVAPPALPGGRLVLLVDDEVGVRRLAARALTKRGWTVLVADSGESALAVLDEDPAHLGQLCAVISDVVMPGMDGPALVRTLRGLRPELPVILTSGYAEEVVRGGLSIEDVLVLSKPYPLKVMLDELEQIALPLLPSTQRLNYQVTL